MVILFCVVFCVCVGLFCIGIVIVMMCRLIWKVKLLLLLVLRKVWCI